MGKRPSFQFYPGDWLRDTALRVCSVGARGLWIDIICLMHEGTPYGYLKVNHKVILTPNLARMVGATLGEVEGWLNELEDAGVFSKDKEGVIYSRRMIKDEELRNKRAAGGKLGGNPILKVNHKVILRDNLKPKSKDKQKPTPSSSSSSINTKEIYKEKYFDFVYLTKDEYKKLQAEFGDDTQNKIGALNNYIGQIGEKAANKRYSSHYHTILTWDRNDKKKQFKNTPSQKKEKILDLNKYLREQDAIFGE